MPVKGMVMTQLDLLEWLEDMAVIKDSPPAQSVQQREWLKQQLKPLMYEMDHLALSPLAVSEALCYYAHIYAQKAQDAILDKT